jgi:hypothetical protein
MDPIMHEDPSLSEELCTKNILESLTVLYGDFAVNVRTGEMKLLLAKRSGLSDGGAKKEYFQPM